MRTEPCKQCGNFDFYVKGEFSYCRPCHKEAQRRYAENKRMGVSFSRKPVPVRSLDRLLGQGLNNVAGAKLRCPKGHAYSGDNLRVEPQGNGIHRRCKSCERNAKRVRYGLTPEPDPVRLTDLLDSQDM